MGTASAGMTEISDGIHKPWQFKPGQSGNPAGKPKGVRHKTTRLVEKLLAEDVEAIVKMVTDAAKQGDMTAARIILDRILPARKDNPVSFDLPRLEAPADAVAAHAAIIEAVAGGDLTPDEGETLAKLIDGFVRSVELVEIDERLRKLEERAGDADHR